MPECHKSYVPADAEGVSGASVVILAGLDGVGLLHLGPAGFAHGVAGLVPGAGEVVELVRRVTFGGGETLGFLKRKAAFCFAAVEGVLRVVGIPRCAFDPSCAHAGCSFLLF
jgi:hypothetical protein